MKTMYYMATIDRGVLIGSPDWLEETAEEMDQDKWGTYEPDLHPSRYRGFLDLSVVKERLANLRRNFSGLVLVWDNNGDWVLTRYYKKGDIVSHDCAPRGFRKHWPWLALRNNKDN